MTPDPTPAQSPAPTQDLTPMDQLPRGCRATIAAFQTEDEVLLARLVEMGFDEGVLVVLTDAAPGRDPLAVRIGATKVALRRALAAAVLVLPEPAAA